MSLGGKNTTTTEIPEYIREPLVRALAQAEEVGKIGYTPYRGATVAAMTPNQQAAMASTNDAASAFGMRTAAPSQFSQSATDYGGGMMGYGTGALYDNAVGQFAGTSPDQHKALSDQFVPQGHGQAFFDARGPQPGTSSKGGATGVQPQVLNAQGNSDPFINMLRGQ